MNIIWVKAGGMVPLDSGGRLRSFHIAKELAKRNKVTLFTFYVEEAIDEHHDLVGTFEQVITHPLKVGSGRGIAEALGYLRTYFQSLPYSIKKYCRPEVAQRLRSVLAAGKYDVIVCDFLNAAEVIPFDAEIPVVMFTHNVEAMIWNRHWEVAASPLWKFVFRREFLRMQRAEIDFLQRSTHVLTVSQTDTEIFSRDVARSKLSTIPTGVEVDYFKPMAGEEPDNLVFTGSMDWMPNEDAILFFVAEILPLIRARRPGVKLWVVGRKPSAKVKLLAEADAAIRVTGRVDDVRPFIAKSTVYVVPLRVGSGTRLKIFEAMAMGKAVVSTTIGAEGLPVTHGTDIALADDPEQMAEAVCDLLESAEYRHRLGRAARRLVEERYSWAAVAKHVEDVLRRQINGPALESRTG